jgi:uncharacterized protein
MAAPTSSRAQAASLQIGDRHRVSALIILPPAARACFVFAHGAGAGMNHRFMEAIATGLGDRTIATLRFQFPYMEAGSGRPDPPALCHATVRAAVEEAARVAPGLPLIAGGRSFGGRMASQAQASSPLPGVRALAFLGFPLHPAKRPSEDRAEHLSQVTIPMLFLQGDRDELAELTLLKSVVARLGSRATLKVIPDADHSYHVRARSGRKDPQVIVELLDGFVEWLGTVL